jgi:amidase
VSGTNAAFPGCTPPGWPDIIAGMRSWITLLLFSWSAFGQTSPTGKWISVLKFFDEPNYGHLQLERNGTALTGKLGNDPFEGTFQNGQIDGTVKPNPRTTIRLHGTLRNDRIEGTGTVVEQKIDLKWEATREPSKPATSRTHTFEPTQFQHFFSDAIEPVLHISPGDTVKTWSVDAGGTDPKGVRRTSGGIP